MVDDNNLSIIDGMLDDVASVIDNDIGITVVYTPVTTVTYGADGVARNDGTPANRSIILYIGGQTYTNLPEGFFLDSDSVAFAKTTDAYVRDGKITYGDVIYRIKNIISGVHSGAGLLFTQRLDLVRIN